MTDGKLTVKELVEQTKELQELFHKIEKKPWSIETFVNELLAEVGTLADSIMIKEGYRDLRKNQAPIDLEDDICDILFVLLMIANHYGIDVGKSYLRMVDITKKKIETKIETKRSLNSPPEKKKFFKVTDNSTSR